MRITITRGAVAIRRSATKAEVMRKIAQVDMRSSVVIGIEGMLSSAAIGTEAMRNGMGAGVMTRSVNTVGTRAVRSARRNGTSVRAAMTAMLAGTSAMPNAGATLVSIKCGSGGKRGNIKRENERKRENTKSGSERKCMSVVPGREEKRASVSVMADASSIPIGNVTAHATITATTVIASIA